MSKSGLFAHFGSREDLLLAVLGLGQEEFLRLVVNPALSKPRGLPRLRTLFSNWIYWTDSADLPGGCPMSGGAAEVEVKAGPVREALAAGQRAWIGTLNPPISQAIEQGQLAPYTAAEQISS
jgi:AcrR family transcriptional regulator